ncbi:MAG: hypothetical protein K2Y21_11435 [Phycisphaerales bacterium]|nr:hypothetical protein [Phycisphaerales bacterium]
MIRFREQLGLPSDKGPLVLSGHQAELWHPGILAKYAAAVEVARAAGGRSAWLVVDQDVPHEFALRVPASDPDKGITRARLPLLEEEAVPRATGWMPARQTVPGLVFPAGSGLGTYASRVHIIRAAIERHAQAGSWAEQLASATAELLAPLGSVDAWVYARRLSATDLFRLAVDALAADPQGGIASYNQAVALASDAEVRPLDAAKGELPLWRIDTSGARRRLLASDLGRGGDRFEGLYPKALLMTALLRLAGCELFVHGIGGYRYDRAMEGWFSSWLQGALVRRSNDWRGRSLAPMLMGTATAQLGLPADGVPELGEIQRALWAAHSARHDPARLGDPAAGHRKRELVAAIRDRKQRGERASEEFAALHVLLAEVRTRHQDKLSELDKRANALAAQREQASVISDRTWSFGLYDPAALRSMWEAIRDKVGTKG